MNNIEMADLLDSIRELWGENGEHWTRHTMCSNRSETVQPTREDEFCLLGAARFLATGEAFIRSGMNLRGQFYESDLAVARAIGFDDSRDAWRFNDFMSHGGGTFEAVRDRLVERSKELRNE